MAEGVAIPLFVDHVGRRLFARTDPYRLVEFDLDAPYGKMQARERTLPMIGKNGLRDNTVAADLTGERAYIADSGGNDCGFCSYIRVLDLRSLEFTAEWNIHELVPNFYIQGLTYSQDDQRVYVVGTVAGHDLTNTLDVLGEPLLPVSVIAIDANTGHLAWYRHLSKCLRLMNTNVVGSHIFRSRQEDVIYLGCSRTEAIYNSASMPGAAGVLRLWISRTADQQEALGFKEEFFRASGAFSELVGPQEQALFDYTTDRFLFVNSSWSTPGAWIFDGAKSSWAGFVPTESSRNYGLGMDQVSGHVFMLDGIETGVKVTDLRSTPVPQGEVVELSSPRGRLAARYDQRYATDPVTRRVFILVEPVSSNGALQSSATKLVAFRDEFPIALPEMSLDYDTLTTGAAEDSETIATFAASAKGFGARAFLVGGMGGMTSPARPGLVKDLYGSLVGDAIPPADRGLWLARVSSIDLRNVGATAASRAAVIDDVTDDQRGSAQRDVANAGAPQAAVSALEWPWPDTFCLDPGDTPMIDARSGPAGLAKVECNLKRETASAAASIGALGEGNIVIGSARFVGSAERRVGFGVDIDSVATVEGFKIEIPGLGALHIDDIRQRVVTHAGGRAKTARVDNESSIEGVHMFNSSGKSVFACETNCNWHDVADHVNDVFSNVLRMRVPVAEKIETPGGAFAAFREFTEDYVNDLVMNNDSSRAVPVVQFEIYNDWTDKSRLVLQFAAIEASAIYGITPTSSLMPEVPDDSLGRLVAPESPLGGDRRASDIPPAGSSRTGSNQVMPRVLRSALFLARAPGDLVSMVLIWLLLGFVVMLCARRGSLLRIRQ